VVSGVVSAVVLVMLLVDLFAVIPLAGVQFCVVFVGVSSPPISVVVALLFPLVAFFLAVVCRAVSGVVFALFAVSHGESRTGIVPWRALP